MFAAVAALIYFVIGILLLVFGPSMVSEEASMAKKAIMAYVSVFLWPIFLCVAIGSSKPEGVEHVPMEENVEESTGEIDEV